MNTFGMLVEFRPAAAAANVHTSGTCFDQHLGLLRQGRRLGQRDAGLRRMPISSVPSLKGGRKVLGKKGTATAATRTATQHRPPTPL